MKSRIGIPPSRWATRAATLAVAALLAGCALVGGNRAPTTIYAPDPRVPADADWPQVAWQLTIARPEAARMLDSTRIVVRPTPGELQVYKGAAWARPPGEQLQDTLLHTLQDSQRIRAVARQGSGLAADYRLELELRRYEADYAGNPVPVATIEVAARLLDTGDRQVVATRTFLQAVPAAGTDTARVAQAFGQALAAIGHDLAGWTLASGQAHARRHPQPSAAP
ncbi:ABC transporter [Luteimonas weifangensis]|uniref:ABC transporter n=1 Tax=Cognatiluteimonas weifangensis TaxID=2303539 RepID=A0A372DLV2_9GAMM|nr:ABC-type transport auxiliary lipoprotein family protein [Luteimonas weifangensis]RFP60543.1 ABC transporter [Luteimonas weifangensis]